MLFVHFVQKGKEIYYLRKTEKGIKAAARERKREPTAEPTTPK